MDSFAIPNQIVGTRVPKRGFNPLYNMELDCCSVAHTLIELSRSSEKDLQYIRPSKQIKINPAFYPQSEQIEKIANVTFADDEGHEFSSPPSEFDEVRDSPMTGDVSLQSFFARPVLIASFNWSTYVDLFETINPWELFWNNKRVSNRINNFRLLRCKLHLKFVINGSPFYFGRAIASYQPLHSVDTLTVNRSAYLEDIVEASQRPNVHLCPTSDCGGEMVLPFYWFENTIDVQDTTYQDFGEINIRSFGHLRTTSGDPGYASISVFAWASDVKFSMPTQFNTATIVPQTDEYSVKPVSRIATTIANIATSMSNIPVIGPYAMATSIGANALSKIAALFGFSKPVMLDSTLIMPRTKANMAVFNAPDDTTKLALDCKQELTLDPRVTGLSGTDEMVITHIASRQSFIGMFQWSLGASSEQLLYNVVVDPCIVMGASNGPYTEYHLPATAVVSYPFLYWRGTLRYTFHILSSSFHRGRLKFVYDPVATPTPTAEYNTVYTQIVDIGENKVITIDVPWGQSTTYMRHANFPNEIDMDNTATLSYVSHVNNFGNGTLSVFVVNELKIQGTSDEPVDVLVHISAGPDFELACPTSLYLTHMAFSPYLQIEPEPILNPEMLPESEDLNFPTHLVPTDDNTNKIHFGESIRSIRQLLKRYCFSEYIPLKDESTLMVKDTITSIHRLNLPVDRGYVLPDVAVSMPVYAIGAGNHVYANMTYINYFTKAFAGWRGSVRYVLSIPEAGCCTAHVTISHDTLDDFPRQYYSQVKPLWSCDCGSNADYLSQAYTAVDPWFTGHSGLTINANSVSPTTSFEIPFYSHLRFWPSKRKTQYRTDPYRSQRFSNTWSAMVAMSKNPDPEDTSKATLFVAAGEDFNLSFYLGLPRVYNYPNPPSV